MKRCRPSDLLRAARVATEKANLVTQIADLEAKLARLKARWPKIAENTNIRRTTAAEVEISDGLIQGLRDHQRLETLPREIVRR
jgi:hypothetical protein